MKLLMPIGIALLGLGVGVGAGVALKPAAEAAAAAACGEVAGAHGDEPVAEGGAAPDAAAACPPAAAAGPLEPAAVGGGHGDGGGAAAVALGKPFVVPVFAGDKVVAMVVASVAVEIDAASAARVEAAEPKLRDGFLAAMFRHANSGGFAGAFTTGQKMADLRAALLAAAREVLAGATVSDVLITEIAKQDV